MIVTPHKNILLKVCGLTRQDDVTLAASLGVRFAGFIFHPQSPRAVDPEWVASVDTGPMHRVGVFVDQDADAIKAIMEKARLDYAQLHGTQSIACARALGAKHVIRVLWPETYSHTAELYNALQRYADTSAYYLFDAGTTGGGHAKTLDWPELYGLKSPHPWFLAGGLTKDNVIQALWDCHPSGLDINSGVETRPGVKDHDAMRTLIHRVWTKYH